MGQLLKTLSLGPKTQARGWVGGLGRLGRKDRARGPNDSDSILSLSVPRAARPSPARPGLGEGPSSRKPPVTRSHSCFSLGLSDSKITLSLFLMCLPAACQSPAMPRQGGLCRCEASGQWSGDGGLLKENHECKAGPSCMFPGGLQTLVQMRTPTMSTAP